MYLQKTNLTGTVFLVWIRKQVHAVGSWLQLKDSANI